MSLQLEGHSRGLGVWNARLKKSKMDSIQRVVLAFVLAVAFAVPCMAREVLQARNWRTERMKFAAHTIGVNYAFMEV